ncbi:hypothetical protein M378DRAFT_171043, partial [Amanita muscaria Koide BX008]
LRLRVVNIPTRQGLVLLLCAQRDFYFTRGQVLASQCTTKMSELSVFVVLKPSGL